jgi:hypothetical protein
VETPLLPPTSGASPPAPVAAAQRRFSFGALAVALVSDVLSVGFELVPPLQLALDGATALALWGLCGWRWPLLPALIVEAIPGLALFPTWSLVVGTLPLLSRAKDAPRPPDQTR